MTKFTSEFIEEQLDNWHNSTNDEWMTDCWNNYGLALEHLQRVVSDLHMHELWHTHYKDECVELKQRIAELEQERRWIPVKEWPNVQGWYRVITGDGFEKTRYWGLDHENNRCFWHVESSNEWIMMWTKPTLPQPQKERE